MNQARRPYDPYPHRRGEPRQFTLWWTGYLLLATLVSYGSGSTSFGFLGYEVTRPAATILISMIGLGIAVLWPMVRLSQTPPQSPHPTTTPLETHEALVHQPVSPALSFFTDAAVVTFPALVVLTAQCMPWMSGWPAPVALTLAGLLATWALLTGALLTFYFRVGWRYLPRWGWMVLHVMLCLIAPLAALITTLAGTDDAPQIETPWSMTVQTLLTLSPLTGAIEITRDRAWTGDAAHVYPHHIIAVLAPLSLIPPLLLRKK